MNKEFKTDNWYEYIPVPIYEERPGFSEFYKKAWELAHDHIRYIDGMPQSPYMDEAFCDTQVWIWDSCFMALFCKFAREAFPGVETLKNFYGVLHGGKKLPEIIPGENEPDWTEATPGVPYEIKIHIADNPPLFAWAEYENALMSGDKEYIKKLLNEDRVLEKHYFWIENLKESVRPEGVLHKTYLMSEKYGYKWEGGRSGMDNTPRGRRGEHAIGQRPNNPDMLWLDVICQQALSAKLISEMFDIIDDEENKNKWNKLYLEKKDIVNELYWDKEDKFYYDIDCNTHEFYKIMTIASYWTMTSGIANKEQAEALVKLLFDPEVFGGIVPLTTLSRSDSDFNPKGEYWRGSVWLPTAYATLKGLASYGYFEEARELSVKLLSYMEKTYTDFEPHTIWECYSPTEHKPATNETGKDEFVRPDFCGWSALGPIAIYIEFILGFYKTDAFSKRVEWAKPVNATGEIGIRNFRFGNIITDITAVGNNITVSSNDSYTLVVYGTEYSVNKGITKISIQ